MTESVSDSLTGSATYPYLETNVASYYQGHYADFIDERPGNAANKDASGNALPFLLRRPTNLTYWSGEYVNGVQAANWNATNITMQDVDPSDHTTKDTLMTAVMGGTVTSSETWADCGPKKNTDQE